MNRLILALAALALSVGLSACNTIKGMGQDIKKAGETIEGAAKK
jgi:predicted small secreted protein